jgi:autotransporter-associated beta strand protein
MTGTGNQTLGGDNSYTGGTTFANGTLTVNHADAIGTTGSLRFTGGTLRFTANNTVDYSSRLTSSAGDFRFDTNGQTVTLASSFGALGNLLTKSGTGTLVITGVASYSGLTTIAAGTLQLGNGGTTGTLASATIDNDGLFVINRSTASSQIQIPLTTGSGSVQIISGNVSVPFDSTYSGKTTIDSLANVSVSLQSSKGSFGTGDIINNGKLSYNHSSDRTVANNFSGAGGFSKNETNSLTLTGNNTTTGIINIINGTLVAGSATALGTSGEIRFGSTTGTLRYSASNAVDYSSRFVAAQTWRIDTNGQNVTFASNLTGTAGTLVKSGMGTLTLTGTNTYEGGTTILDGVLALGSSGALGTTGRISFFNSAGTLRFSAANTTDYSSRFDNSVLQTRTIDTNGQNVTFAGTLPGSSSTLTKVGTGTLTLNGNTTYDSATAINGGRLHINGTNQSSSTVVNSGGTLGGTGTLAGPVSVNAGGTLAPGTSPGNLTIDDNVTFASGSNFSVELNGTTIGTQYDRLTVNGTVALGNATLATSIGYTPALGHRLFIIANDGSDAITGTFNGIANGQQVSQGGYFFTVHYGADLSSGNLTGGNDVALSNFQPVPEPGTILGMGLLTVVLFGFRFHQRIKQGLTPRRGNTTSATRRAVPGTRPSFAPTR